MRGHVDKAHLDHLAKVPLFSACTQKDLITIAQASDEVTVPAGHVLTTQGEAGNQAFVLVEGTATVTRNGQTVASLGPGDVVGELSLLDHGPRTATVITNGPATVLVLDQRHFSAVLDQVPALSHKLLASLAAKVRAFDQQTYG